MRRRGARALSLVARRPEERVALVCHGSFIRALVSEALALGEHHSVQFVATGGTVELWRIAASGSSYWELQGSQEVVALTSRQSV